PGWVVVDRAEAERRLGREVVTLAELPIASIEVREDDRGTAVRGGQLLTDGPELVLTQRPAADPAAGMEAESEGFPDDWSTVTEEREGLWLVLSGPLGEDALSVLLSRAP